MVLACRDSVLVLMTGAFGAAVLALMTVSLGVQVPWVAVVLQLGGFATLWLPMGHMLLLGCSSGLVPVGAGEAKR